MLGSPKLGKPLIVDGVIVFKLIVKYLDYTREKKSNKKSNICWYFLDFLKIELNNLARSYSVQYVPVLYIYTKIIYL